MGVVVEFLFFLFGGLVILENLYTLWSGLRYHYHIRRFLTKDSPPTFRSCKAVVIIPCKGLDPGFKENIQAFFQQDYPVYDILFVTATPEDPAFSVLHQIIRENPRIPAKVLIAGWGSRCSQKIHNLRIAVQNTDPEDEIYVFADSDIRPHPQWLRNLIRPLLEEWEGTTLEDQENPGQIPPFSRPSPLPPLHKPIGATTGYRWYLPDRRNLGSLLRVIWNGNVLSILEDPKLNFAWGGSMAIPRKLFEKTGVLQSWEGALSDDYALTWALKKRGYRILFVPQCLVLSHENCSLREFLEWSTRQMIITRVYHPLLWKLGAFSFTVYNGTLGLGLALILNSRNPNIWVWGILGSLGIFPLLKSSLRLKTVLEILPIAQKQLKKHRWSYVFLSPVVAILNFYIFLHSALTRCITWRGITYEMKSPTETILLGKN
jgi:cellulose synthase/poly-beta-1,6-N-acetylglucosamine synthase-like glycosyltransferase